MNIRICTLLLGLFLFVKVSHTQDLGELFDDITIETVEDIPYESPTPKDPQRVYFHEHFDDAQTFKSKWTKSMAKKDGIEEEIAKYDGEWAIEQPVKDGLHGDKGLVLKSKAKHAAISSTLTRPFVFDTKPLIVQYEVVLQEGQECGGAYLKLLSTDNKDLKQFTDKTPYAIMFGPDKCGNDYKLHFIFKHKNPLNGSVEEKHCQKPKERLEEIYDDKLPHLYTLIVRPDNTFEIQIDQKIVNSGSLLADFTPAVNPPAEIEDPTDVKPEDWDEREKIPDPEAVKPADWDEDAPAQIVDEAAIRPDGWLDEEATHIADPEAVKPADWDAEMDGEWEPALIENPLCLNAPGCGRWEPPLINNPDFKGKWRAPFIDNPNYKGKWRPRTIPNPDYFEDRHPFKLPTVSAIGFELWSMSKDILFDNILITDDLLVAEQWAAETFAKKRQKIAKDSESVIQKIANITNDYPMLWALYILVLGIPVVLVLYLCFKPSSSPSQKMEKEELKQAAERKKTDADTAAAAAADDDADEKQNDDDDDNKIKAENDDDDDGDEADEDEEKYSNPDSDEDNEAVAEDKKPQKSDDGPRKRKARKE